MSPFKRIWRNHLSFLLVFLWMTLIFFLSRQTASESSELSASVLVFLLNTVESLIGEFGISVHTQTLHTLLRKSAHFFMYSILGILVSNALFRRNILQHKNLYISFALCTVYAVLDELHQYFIPGRSCELTDVLIDSAGAAFGISLYWLFRRKHQ